MKKGLIQQDINIYAPNGSKLNQARPKRFRNSSVTIVGGINIKLSIMYRTKKINNDRGPEQYLKKLNLTDIHTRIAENTVFLSF